MSAANKWTSRRTLQPGTNHTLVFDNRHRPAHAVYLMNALVPDSASMTIVAQRRSATQARYEIDYRSAPPGQAARPHAPLPAPAGGDPGVFGALFALGLRHIAGGFDHLLFVLVLLLPAPLLASGGRWAGADTVGRSLRRLLAIVTAFTAGHSLTLLLAALGGITLPAAPVEVLIALSVFVSALHAIRPLFARREAWVAGAFGLVHGLAFAATLSALGAGAWTRVSGVVAFNLGIEAMQLLVVAAVLPALLLMRGTPAYAWLRVPAALAAALASAGWMVERVGGADLGIDACFGAATRHAPAAVAVLFAVALAARLRMRARAGSPHDAARSSRRHYPRVD
jgi:hypothetical protein